MNVDRFCESKEVVALTAAQGAIGTGSNTGESIDTFGYGSLTVGLNVSTVTAGEIDSIVFQESSDNGVADAWEDVADESLFYPDGFPITATGTVLVGCVAKERYVRLNITGDATADIVIDAALGLLQDSEARPQRKESSVLADADVNSPGTTADAVSTPPKRTA